MLINQRNFLLVYFRVLTASQDICFHSRYRQTKETLFSLFWEALFEWFLDVCCGLNARLLVNIFVAKANEFYNVWLRQQEGEVPEEKRLKFSRLRIKG